MKRTIYSYSVFFEHDPDGGYVATVPALPGCHSQGETVTEVVSNIREAIDLYIESLVAHDEPIPREFKPFQRKVRVFA